MLLGCALGMIACLSTIDRILPVIIVARICFGASVGILNCVSARYIEENVPAHLYEVFSPNISVGYGIGTILSFSLAFILPEDTDIDGLKNDTKWKIICAYFPIGLYSLFVIGLLMFITEDPIKYLIQKGKTE